MLNLAFKGHGAPPPIIRGIKTNTELFFKQELQEWNQECPPLFHGVTSVVFEEEKKTCIAPSTIYFSLYRRP